MTTGRWLDVGSGAGLPGIVLAIMCPQISLTLLEPRARRARFLTQALIELDLTTVEVVAERLENVPSGQHDWIICRAFASLTALGVACRALVPGLLGVCAMKAEVAGQELAAAQAALGPASIIALQVPGFANRNLVIFDCTNSGLTPANAQTDMP